MSPDAAAPTSGTATPSGGPPPPSGAAGSGDGVRHGTDRRDLSIVIPVYNEEECLPLLERELVAVLGDWPHPWEVILVDDASTDATPRIIAEICERDARFRTIRFAENCRQSAAMAAGFRAARGAITITLDADLQNDPADIPALVQHMGQYDCVCGYRAKRQDTWFRRTQSRIANGFRNWILGETITDTGCSLKAYRTDILQRILLFRGAHRFLATLMRMEGATVMETPVNHRPRAAGTPKWGLWNRVFRATYDLFGVRWLRTRALRYRIAHEAGSGLTASGLPVSGASGGSGVSGASGASGDGGASSTSSDAADATAGRAAAPVDPPAADAVAPTPLESSSTP